MSALDVSGPYLPIGRFKRIETKRIKSILSNQPWATPTINSNDPLHGRDFPAPPRYNALSSAGGKRPSGGE